MTLNIVGWPSKMRTPSIGYQGWLYQKILGSGKCDNFKYCLGFEIGKSCAYTVGTWSYLCLLCLQKEENNSKELLELLEG